MSEQTDEILISAVVPITSGSASSDLRAFFEKTIQILEKNYSQYEIIVTSDSTFLDFQEIQNLLTNQSSARHIRISGSSGLEPLMHAGLDAAIGAAVVVILPSMDPPERIPDMVEQSIRTKGIALGSASEGKKVRRSWATRLSQSLIRWAFGWSPPKHYVAFLSLPRPALNALLALGGQGKISRYLIYMLGFPISEVPYSPTNNQEPERGIRSIRLTLAFIVAHSKAPLRFASIMCLLFSMINVFYLAYAVLIKIFRAGTAEGWAAISFHTSLMFAALFVLLAIFGEYLGKIMSSRNSQLPYNILEDRISEVEPETSKAVNIFSRKQ